jgi:DNA polymerase-3 subunit gamma/tau
VVAAVPDALTSGLVEAAPDQAERLSSQAASLGPGELTRAAEVIATGLTDMRGTTAPRLHLELMCARVLLPGADVDDRGLHARLDRLERRMGVTGTAPAPAAPAAPASPTPLPAEPVETPPKPEDLRGPAGGESDDTTLGAEPPVPADSSPGPVFHSGGTPPEPPGAGLTVTDVRRLWPEILEEVKNKRRFTWILLSQNAQVAELRNNTLLLAMSNAGARDSFSRGGSEDVLREAIVVVLGADFTIETMVDSGSGSAGPARTPHGAEPPAPSPPSPPTPAEPMARDQARQGIRPTRTDRGPTEAGPDERDALASRDDSDLDESATSHRELLTRHLGAEIIAEDEPDA